MAEVDLGRIRRVVKRIKNWFHWLNEWSKEGVHVNSMAEKALSEGNILTARNLFHEAAGCYHVGQHFFYFDDEKKASYQGRLPEWAMSYTGTIRRFGGKVRPDHMLDEQELQERNKKRREKQVNDVIVDCDTGEVVRSVKVRGERQERTYEAIIKDCGSQSMVTVCTSDGVGTEILDIRFSEWRKYESSYDEDLKATIVFLSSRQLNEIREEFNISRSVLDLLDGKNWGKTKDGISYRNQKKKRKKANA